MSDLISRQAAIDAVEKAVFKGVAKSAIESLPPVEPKPVCEDAISRNWILRTLETWQKVSDYNEAEQNIIAAAICEVKEAPPVEPERPKGEWKTDMVYAGIEFYRCDQCEYRQSEKTRYCPNCGADCRGDKE